MTDTEIIKALRLCRDPDTCSDDCCFYVEGETIDECTSKLSVAALDLIQRQQEEIKLLKQRRVNMFEILEAAKRDLVRDCINCVHCKENLAYEECKKRTKSKIIYNGLKEAKSCGHYEQKGGRND